MVMIRAFRGVRPQEQLAAEVASFPYDVLSSDEASVLAAGHPHSFLHVEKAEIDLAPSTPLHHPKVYETASNNFKKMQEQGILRQDEQPHLYLYQQQMGQHRQWGIVASVSVDEYRNNIIKKHELTRQDKEDDRLEHICAVNANAGPVFLTYLARPAIDQMVTELANTTQPTYDFCKEDGIFHRFWLIPDPHLQNKLIQAFAEIDFLYIADGHHRSAAAARARDRKRAADPTPHPEREYNFFLAVIFPHNQLKIMDYNRLVSHLNGLGPTAFLRKIETHFEIDSHPSPGKSPAQRHEFAMYLGHQWYLLRAREGSFRNDDPVAALDVSILQNNLLEPILGIKDPRTDKRIDFVGGIRGLQELEKRVNSHEAQVAFALFPTSIDELMAVALQDQIMPPKSTWFEPKLRSGLVVHLLD